MTTGFVGVCGMATVWLLARSARVAAVVQRVPGTLPRASSARSWWRGRLERGLARYGIPASPDDLAPVLLVGIGMAVLVAVAVSAVIAVVGSIALLASAPPALRALDARRARRVQAAIPGLLRRVADELRSGGTIVTAIDAVASTPGPIAASMTRVLGEVHLGASLIDGLERWAAHAETADVRVVAGALSIAEELGGPSATALDGLASSFEDRLAVIAEARALSTQARLSAWIVGLAPIAFLGFTALSDATALRVLTTSGPGRVCLAVGLLLEALAMAWIRRIVAVGAQ